MHPHEDLAELLLETRERLVQQELALGRADRDVLQLGLEIDHIGDRHQINPAALAHRKIAAWSLARRGRGALERLAAHRTGFASLLERGEEARSSDRLQQ